MRLGLLLALLVSAAGCASVSPERQLIDDAVAALGGRDAILAIERLTMSGRGFVANVGQNMSPESEEVGDDLRDFTRTIDFVNNRGRSEYTRAPAFVSPADPYRQIQRIDGDVAYSAGGFFDPKAERTTRTPPRMAQERAVEWFLHHPLGIVRAALDPAATIANPRSDGNWRFVEIHTARGERVRLEIDAATGLPASVASTVYHANLGDVVLKTTFDDYQESAGVKIPMRLTSTLDRWPGTDLRLATYVVNAASAGLDQPQSVSRPPAPSSAPAMTIEPLAPGVWVLGDGSFSLLVEFADHTVLVEVPTEARTLALIAKARELVPNKPLTKAITTHHHFDHAGGLRAAIAAGLTIVTHEGNKASFEELARRKHSIVEDALARNPQPLKLETVGDRLVLKDAVRTMELHHVPGSAHADTLLVVYLPKEKILLQADLYFPPFVRQPYAANLLALMAARNMRVDRQVSVHGGVQTQAQVVQRIRAGT